MTSIVISMRDVSASYRSAPADVRVLRNMTLSIAENEILVLVGPNGSGKSTVLRLIAGLASPSTGVIERTRDGRDVPPSSLRIAYAAQDYRASLFPWLSVRENVALPTLLRGSSVRFGRSGVDELLREFLPEVSPSLPVYKLSGGQQQIVCLCRLLVSDGDITLGDEPLSALDIARCYSVVERLQEHWSASLAPKIWVSHNVDEALLLADSVAFLSKRSGDILTRIRIDLRRPRRAEDLLSPELLDARREILSLLKQERG